MQQIAMRHIQLHRRGAHAGDAAAIDLGRHISATIYGTASAGRHTFSSSAAYMRRTYPKIRTEGESYPEIGAQILLTAVQYVQRGFRDACAYGRGDACASVCSCMCH